MVWLLYLTQNSLNPHPALNFRLVEYNYAMLLGSLGKGIEIHGKDTFWKFEVLALLVSRQKTYVK